MICELLDCPGVLILHCDGGLLDTYCEAGVVTCSRKTCIVLHLLLRACIECAVFRKEKSSQFFFLSLVIGYSLRMLDSIQSVLTAFETGIVSEQSSSSRTRAVIPPRNSLTMVINLYGHPNFAISFQNLPRFTVSKALVRPTNVVRIFPGVGVL